MPLLLQLNCELRAGSEVRKWCAKMRLQIDRMPRDAAGSQPHAKYKIEPRTYMQFTQLLPLPLIELLDLELEFVCSACRMHLAATVSVSGLSLNAIECS